MKDSRGIWLTPTMLATLKKLLRQSVFLRSSLADYLAIVLASEAHMGRGKKLHNYTPSAHIGDNRPILW